MEISTRHLSFKFFLFVFYLFSIFQKKKLKKIVTLNPRHGILKFKKLILRNKRRVDISIHIILLVGWGGGGEQNMLLDNRFLNMSDCLRTSSALLKSRRFIGKASKIVHERNRHQEIFSRAQVTENSRQYLLLRTDILQKTVVGCPY